MSTSCTNEARSGAGEHQRTCVELDGKLIPDSTSILDALEAKRPEKLDAHLDPTQKAIGRAFKSMLEEHLYFGVLFMRWACDDGWAVFESAKMLGPMGVPALVRGLVTKSARKYTVGRTRAQGIGRKPRDEVVAICSHIADAPAQQFGDRKCFCGDRPTTYDATS